MRQAQPSRRPAALLSLLLLPVTWGLGACVGTTQEMVAPTAAPAEATEAPAEATPTAVSQAPAALLEAKGAGVSLSVADAEARLLSDGESAELSDGGTVVVGSGASARLSWGPAGESSAELLGDSSLSLQPAEGETALALTQDAGTVRYTAAAPAEVAATGLMLRAAGGSSFVVSLNPKAPLWVGVAEGSVELNKASPVAMASAASAAASVTLKAGQAAAFDSSGKLLGQVDLPQAKLEAWYQGLSSGKVAPMAQLAAPKPAAAQAVSAPAVAAPVSASFNADATVVDAGACTNLRWSAPDALFVTLDGSDVPNTGSQQVCLSEPKTFKLSWVGKDGKELSSTVGISIRSISTDGGDEEEEVEAPPQPTPEPTECIGPECEIPLEPVGEDPVVNPGDPAPAEPPPAEPAPAEPAPAEPQPEPQPTP